MANDGGVEVRTTPPDLFRRLGRYRQKIEAVNKIGMKATMIEIHGSVPPYPPTPAGGRSSRTGQLGRALGSGQGGGKVGPADIQKIRRIGHASFEGRFGTNLSYAPRVIGEGTQQRPWSGYWWTIKTVAKRALPGIIKIWRAVSEEMAAFLEGRG